MRRNAKNVAARGIAGAPAVPQLRFKVFLILFVHKKNKNLSASLQLSKS
jgi:hypothetical protein